MPNIVSVSTSIAKLAHAENHILSQSLSHSFTQLIWWPGTETFASEYFVDIINVLLTTNLLFMQPIRSAIHSKINESQNRWITSVLASLRPTLLHAWANSLSHRIIISGIGWLYQPLEKSYANTSNNFYVPRRILCSSTQWHTQNYDTIVQSKV